MYDTIQGPVTQIVDGDTFDMKVIEYGTHNKYTYNKFERIRIAGSDAPEIDTTQGQIAKDNLVNTLTGNSIKCSVHSRDTFGRLICDVLVL